ncbi:MAG: BA14K family protein [Proteobacteria bacterium]|nr:BA14K family protein [Pseudomonadota bacterium]
MRFSRIVSAALVAGAASISLQSAMAAPLTVDRSLATSAMTPQTVQYRDWRHDGWPGPGAAIGGLTAGAIIGGAIAESQARAASNDAFCGRFNSYDPASRTYLGYDGSRHPCP